MLSVPGNLPWFPLPHSDPHAPNMPLFMYTLTSNYKCWHKHQEVPLSYLVLSTWALVRAQAPPGLWTAHPQDLSYSRFHSVQAGPGISFGLPVSSPFLITLPSDSFFLPLAVLPPYFFLNINKLPWGLTVCWVCSSHPQGTDLEPGYLGSNSGSTSS